MHHHNALISLRSAVGASLADEMTRRPKGGVSLSWVNRERAAVVAAANQWVAENGIGHWTTMSRVKELEGGAIGHIDYASKVALYVAREVLGETPYGY